VDMTWLKLGDEAPDLLDVEKLGLEPALHHRGDDGIFKIKPKLPYSFRRCDRGSSWNDASLASGATGNYTTTASNRLWNNAIPANTLGNLKGMDICYIVGFNRQTLSSPGGNDTTADYWGSLDGSTENRCSVTVGHPWILQPSISSPGGAQNTAVGDASN
jgi:hypothetical protein